MAAKDVDSLQREADKSAHFEDAQDPLRHLRQEFIIPTKSDLHRKTVSKNYADDDPEPSVYLCGNSLGLQPRRTKEFVQKTLDTWGTKGALGHFTPFDDSLVPNWVAIHERCHQPLANLVGARPHEIAVMQTLTANLHLLMASFFRPTAQRHKIICEEKAFPSDHFAIESQLRHHSLTPSDSMITIQPPNAYTHYLPTEHIIHTIQQHADTTALVLLPGIQYYSGQLLDIRAITAAAHEAGIPYVGWDLAHAVGNVELALHDAGVDFAAWCHYKYMNGGPGTIGGLFVHEKHGEAVAASQSAQSAENGTATNSTNSTNGTIKGIKTPKLHGWWGTDPASRFQMNNANFRPIPGAGSWQLSNPSALDISALIASLSVFEQTSMRALRERSVRMTGWLEKQLKLFNTTSVPSASGDQKEEGQRLFDIITPANPAERGAQLSLRVKSELLEDVMAELARNGVVVDERKPDVIRVAPAPLYNSYEDMARFVGLLRGALVNAERRESAH